MDPKKEGSSQSGQGGDQAPQPSGKEPFVPGADRPEVRLNPDMPVSDMTLRDLSAILQNPSLKKIEIKEPIKDNIKDKEAEQEKLAKEPIKEHKEKPEKLEQKEKLEKHEKVEKLEKHEKTEKHEKLEKPEHKETIKEIKHEKIEHKDKLEKLENDGVKQIGDNFPGPGPVEDPAGGLNQVINDVAQLRERLDRLDNQLPPPEQKPNK